VGGGKYFIGRAVDPRCGTMILETMYRRLLWSKRRTSLTKSIHHSRNTDVRKLSKQFVNPCVGRCRLRRYFGSPKRTTMLVRHQVLMNVEKQQLSSLIPALDGGAGSTFLALHMQPPCPQFLLEEPGSDVHLFVCWQVALGAHFVSTKATIPPDLYSPNPIATTFSASQL
jgi:hypothetical protein